MDDKKDLEKKRKEREKQIKELVLLLLYLTRYEEKKAMPGYFSCWSWKGYPFEALNELTDEGYLAGKRRNKSVFLTEEGVKKGKALEKRFLG